MFSSARTRIHLCADNRPWKENYNQSQGRKEGTAHALQPNILIYKETIKYFKSRVASRSVHWWLDCRISVYLLLHYLPHMRLQLIFFISSSTSPYPQSPTSFSLYFFLISHSLHYFHLCDSALVCSSNLCQFSHHESILVNIVLPHSSFRAHAHTHTRMHAGQFLSTSWLAILTPRPCTECPKPASWLVNTLQPVS